MTAQFRRSLFFWLGVGVFPVFWSWFTLGRHFPRWQRHLALGWMGAVVATLALTWPQMAERYFLMSLGLPFVSFQVSLWLWVWLVFRALRPSIFDLILCYWIFGGVLGALVPAIHKFLQDLTSQDFSSGWALMPLVPALLHLTVDPGRSSLARLNGKTAGVQMFWICFALIPACFVGFTADPYFSRRERLLAWSWTALHTTVILTVFPFLRFGPLPAIVAVSTIIAMISRRGSGTGPDHPYEA